MRADVTCVVDAKNILGEGPIWCPVEQVLYWIDISKPSLNRFDPRTGAVNTWELPKPPGSFALRKGGGLLVAFRSGLAWLQPPSGRLEWIDVAGLSLDRGRFNDGKCDRNGRFWVGTLDRHLTDPIGELYRIDPDLSCRTMDRGFTISNGIAWSPDDRTMYFTDSPPRRIYAYDFDLEAGAVSNRRVFASLAGQPGRPDGCTVDSEGYLWAALVDGWRILRLAADGRVDRVIEFPVQRPTSCIFGGPNLGALFVTSSTLGLTPQELEKQPLAGGVFRIEVGVRGLPEPRFAG